MKPKEKEKILQKSTSEISVDFKEQTPKVEIHSPKTQSSAGAGNTRPCADPARVHLPL